jgi:hypothetical protein
LKKPLSCAIWIVTPSLPSSTPTVMSLSSGALVAVVVGLLAEEPELHAARPAASATDASTGHIRRRYKPFIALLEWFL